MRKTIPVSRLIQQAEFLIRIHRDNAFAYAEALRENRIDWVSANNLIDLTRNQAIAALYALAAPLFDMVTAHAQIEGMRLGFNVLIDGLLEDLRKTCLLNGPTRRRAA